MLKLQPELWVTVNACPAMVSVPVRAGPVVGATSNCTVPFPLPLPPPAIAIHGTLLVAVHGHAAALVTPTDPEPPALATENDCVLIPKVRAVSG